MFYSESVFHKLHIERKNKFEKYFPSDKINGTKNSNSSQFYS